MSTPAGSTSTRRKISCWPAGCCGTNTAGRCPARWSSFCACRAWAGKRRICCWAIFMGRPARSSATRTASASATCWALPAARTRQRSSSSCARFCRRRNPPISATGSSCTAGPSARQESPRATAAASPHTAKALRGNEHACPFYVKSLKFNRSWSGRGSAPPAGCTESSEIFGEFVCICAFRCRGGRLCPPAGRTAFYGNLRRIRTASQILNAWLIYSSHSKAATCKSDVP